MQRLRYLIQKEFIQIGRNKAMLPLMTVIPIVQMIVLSLAASSEVKDVKLAIFDQDKSVYSRLLLDKIQQADRFVLVAMLASEKEADAAMQEGTADIVLGIMPDFEKSILKEKRGTVQLLVNAINGQQATVGAGYLNVIIQSFQKEVLPVPLGVGAPPMLELAIESRNWYNPQLDFKYFMVPGIMGELATILVILLTAMNIVRERELGTIEQINVTPIRKWEFILGKMIPFLVIGMLLLTVGLTVGKLLFDIPIRGSLWVVFAYCIVNLIAVLGLGFFISNISDTQQQALFTTFFFVIIFILMSGLFTPIESMPKLAQYLTWPNPIAHFVHVMRSVLLKGSTFTDVAFNFKITAILAIVFNTLAVLSYRKVN